MARATAPGEQENGFEFENKGLVENDSKESKVQCCAGKN